MPILGELLIKGLCIYNLEWLISIGMLINHSFLSLKLQAMDINNESKESLLVLDQTDGGKVKAVSGIDDNGNLKTVPPTKDHESDFMRIDKHSSILENFFSNFMRQAKDPTHFQFFKISTDAIDSVTPVIESMAKQNTPSANEMLSQYKVNLSDYIVTVR